MRGLFFGDVGQLGAQCVGVLANVVLVFAASFGFFWFMGRVWGNSVSAEVEHYGLDLYEMGTDAYPRE